MTTSITKPVFSEQDTPILEQGMGVLVQQGNYPNRNSLVREAINLWLVNHPDQRLTMAMQLYQNEVVSLGRAAELAGLSLFDFEAILRARGIELVMPDETPADIQAGVDLILGRL